MAKKNKLLKLLIAIAGISGCLLTNSAASQVKTQNNPERAIAKIPVTRNITIDRFGYRPQDPKVAIIADPQVSFDSQKSFT